MSGQTYLPADPTEFQQSYDRALQRRTGSGDKGWKPIAAQPGHPPHRNIARLMPRHPNMRDVFVEYMVHFGLGPNQDTFSWCLEPYGIECPACMWQAQLYSRAKQATDPNVAKQLKDLAYKIRKKINIAGQIVDMAHPEKGVVRYYPPDQEHKRIRGCFLSDDQPPQFIDITHPEHGFNLVLECSVKPSPQGQEWITYDTIRKADRPSALPDMAWLEQIKDLNEMVFQPTVDQVAGALQGKRIERPSTSNALPAGTPPAALPAARTPVPAAPAAAAVPVPSAPVPAAATTPAAPVPAPTTAAPTPAPAPAAPPVAAPAAAGRRTRGAAPAPAAAAAPTPGAPAAATVVRTPVLPPQPVVAGEPTYAAARAWCAQQGFAEPLTISQQEMEAHPKPSCWTTGCDPTDKQACQQCRLILPCGTAQFKLNAA